MKHLTDAPPKPDDDVAPESSLTSRAVRSIVEWVVIVAGALLVALIIRTFVVQPFYIPSASMDPELRVGDRVLVNKLSYRLHDIHRGDIVVFERPECAARQDAIKDLIKRVVGLPGDRVEGRSGSVWVNGRRLVEDYLPGGQTTGDFGPVEVPPDHIWVMGDNRENSTDSRILCNNAPTFIAEDDVVGRAFIRVWPLGELSLL